MTAPSRGTLVAIGFGPAAVTVLRRLEQAGLAEEIRWPPGSDSPATEADEHPGEAASAWLAARWTSVRGVVAVGACGLITRLVAPLLTGKNRDPAVVVIDPQGRFAIPLLGGHAAGADRICQEIAALLDGQAVTTGSGTCLGTLALDAFGRDWGWRRGGGDWTALMVATSRGRPPVVRQQSGLALWRELEAAGALLPPGGGHGSDAQAAPADPGGALVIGPHLGPGCRWHPPCLWLGLGCERDTSLAVLERLVQRALREGGLAEAAVAGLASVDRKGDEPALLELAGRHGWPLRLFSADALALVPVPHPSEQVAREMGTASVAEAAALLAAGGREGTPDGSPVPLLVPKTIERAGAGERGAATLAVAQTPEQWSPSRGALHLVGSGPGRLDLLTGDARRALAAATVWVGYGLYLDLLEPLRRPDQLRRDGHLTEERARCAEALQLAGQGVTVALISSGDSGIYGMAGLALELWLALPRQDRPAFAVHPGLSALQVAAARAGAPLMHDFCTISLSDRLTPWEVIERRLRAAAEADFVVALYNPRSQGRHWQLGRARELLLECRPASTPVVLARQLGREAEQVKLVTLGELRCQEVDMLTLVLIGNSSSYQREGWIVTPRGYPGADLA
jgi:cobalt-precorrin 5A hydrolase/precorrin-3B C17-methyltransferase